MIFAIDPGNIDSAYVVWNENTEKALEFGKVKNEELIKIIDKYKDRAFICGIEMLSVFGGTVGSTVLDTCVWIGRFMERWGPVTTELFFRKTLVTYHCGNPRANDSAIRSVMISRFGNGNTRKQQTGTTLEGMSADVWQSLAVAVYISDRTNKKVFVGASDFVKDKTTQLKENSNV